MADLFHIHRQAWLSAGRCDGGADEVSLSAKPAYLILATNFLANSTNFFCAAIDMAARLQYTTVRTTTTNSEHEDHVEGYSGGANLPGVFGYCPQ
jgi:hypothetical protein